MTSPSTAQTHAWPPAAALTTVFTPVGYYCSTGYFKFDTEDCMPPHWSEYFYTPGAGYYSPAICPSGYISGCTRTNDPSSSYGPPLIAGETDIICCPSSYVCSGDLSYCISSFPSPTTITETDTYTNTYTSPITTETDTYTDTYLAIEAYAIQVRWQASDLTNLATDPLTPGVTHPTITSPSATPTPTGPSNSTVTVVPHQGLSTGAKVGIGVGVAVGVLAIIAGVALCLFRRRQKKTREAGQMSRDSMASPMAPNFSGAQAVPGYSSPPVMAAAPPGHSSFDLESQRLREEQAKLQERKDRLLQIEQIEEEQEMLRQRLAYSQENKSPQSLSTQVSDPQELRA